jgi:hypothetical protein
MSVEELAEQVELLHVTMMFLFGQLRPVLNGYPALLTEVDTLGDEIEELKSRLETTEGHPSPTLMSARGSVGQRHV